MASHPGRRGMDTWGGYTVNFAHMGQTITRPSNLRLYNHLTTRDAQDLAYRELVRMMQRQPYFTPSMHTSIVQHRLETEILIREKASHFLNSHDFVQTILNRIDAEERGVVQPPLNEVLPIVLFVPRDDD